MSKTKTTERLDLEGARAATLPDGGTVLIRPLRSGDAPALERTYDRLGERSRYRRFGTAFDRLPAGDFARLSKADHDCHEAVVALDLRSDEIVGVAHYFRLPGRASEAEIAEEVIDAWQHRGVGRLLALALTELARARGIDRLHAFVSPENTPVRAALARSGAIARGDDYVTELSPSTENGAAT
jgi:RimJ/RimL family protein N-acetyltransferase